MAELAEFPVIGWIAQRFRGKPQPTVETPPLISLPHIKLIHDPVTDKPIFCIYNRGGPRVYIMRRDEIQGFPVIIRIAACDKERQIQVLTTISKWEAKRIKRLGKI